jgi:predicted permease
LNLVLNSLLPLFVLIALGVFLRRTSLVGESFFKTSDRLVYYVFFPALLFLKISRPTPTFVVHWTWLAVLLAMMVLVAGASLVAAHLLGLSRRQVGAFSQTTYRFNTYLGMAVVLSLMGETGVKYLGLLISAAIPLANLMAVSGLIWCQGAEARWRARLGHLIRELVVNPLIIACLAGLVYGSLGWGLPVFVDRTLDLLGNLSLPLALLSIGAALRFAPLRRNQAPALAAVALKQVALPGLGLAGLWLAGATGDFWRVAVIWLCLPTSTLAYVLAAQLDGDADLTAAVVVVSHLFAVVTLSAAVIWVG